MDIARAYLNGIREKIIKVRRAQKKTYKPLSKSLLGLNGDINDIVNLRGNKRMLQTLLVAFILAVTFIAVSKYNLYTYRPFENTVLFFTLNNVRKSINNIITSMNVIGLSLSEERFPS